ncbi:MAPEG family protein [Candidatus Uabimicrobium amorphum]|uniref:Membrane protein n=1 Tax=Uabimicrobium amorphum TaxID=2596890 RepID=A0A5S9IQU4_UABAM|nr:MAPEG family protein [Candidatus Uabimicrobium amorphum]BBM85946.1 membrane protein [Candidatus Uabimicrobium amorphum]
MDNKIIFLPLFAQVALTGMVWLWMYVTRLKEIYVKKINVQDLADSAAKRDLLKKVSGPSDNFINLFEMPVLFYVAIFVIYNTGIVSSLYITLAFCFVGLRFVHSAIQGTYNRIKHRFAFYLLSSLSLWTMWVIIIVEIVSTMEF